MARGRVEAGPHDAACALREPAAGRLHGAQQPGLDAGTHGPNTDGIDPDGCTRLRISDCFIQSGDDAIVRKITNRPGGNRSCRDITVTNCVLETRETALKIGSETYGEFRNISFSNCAVRDAGCGVGLWMRDGGVIEGWTVNNISMTLTGGGQAVYMTSYPRSRLPEPGRPREEERPPGTVRGVMISNFTAIAGGCVFLCGFRRSRSKGSCSTTSASRCAAGGRRGSTRTLRTRSRLGGTASRPTTSIAATSAA